MKRILLLLILVLLAGCGGGGNVENAAQLKASPDDLGAKRGLQLIWNESGSAVDITLVAGQAEDLYQAAATVVFPDDKYTITEVTPAGGLGSPSETFFAGAVSAPGRLEFGYTKRYAGPGEFGDVELLRFRVAESGEFQIDDFRIDYEDQPPLVRNSDRQPIELPRPGGVQ